ncbi:DMT family transporter [Rhodobacterales bacterium]|nr:DMT family transporter [Rhodobacterales bacterium]
MSQGILAITAAVFLLSLSDALVKSFSTTFGLGQMLAVRSALAAGLLVLFMTAVRKTLFAHALTNRWVLARSLCLTLMWVCYYAALPAMSFPVAAACFYTSPMWMTLLSAGVMRRRMPARNWAASGLGLAGVLAMVRPDAGAATPAMILPLLAAFLYAVSAMITGAKCRAQAPLAMAVNLNLVLSGAGLCLIVLLAVTGTDREDGFLRAIWPVLGPGDWGVLIATALMAAVITALVAFAYQRAPAPTVGLFDNGYLVFAAFWGMLLFAEPPGVSETIGMLLIGAGAILSAMSPTASRQ